MRFDNAGNDIRTEAGGNRERTVIVCMMSLVIVAFFALAGRCFYLQHNLADYYGEKCIVQQRAYLPLEPQRGAILDARGRSWPQQPDTHDLRRTPNHQGAQRNSTRLAPILDMGLTRSAS